MQNVLVLGGGVGGTLAANLISRKLKKQIDAGEAKVTVVDAKGEHVYQPGYMYIAMGNQDPKSLRKPERRLLDDRVDLVIGEVTAVDDEARQITLASSARAGGGVTPGVRSRAMVWPSAAIRARADRMSGSSWSRAWTRMAEEGAGKA